VWQARRSTGAPVLRPLLLVSATGDWTKNTLEQEYPAVKRVYAMFGADDRVHGVRLWLGEVAPGVEEVDASTPVSNRHASNALTPVPMSTGGSPIMQALPLFWQLPPRAGERPHSLKLRLAWRRTPCAPRGSLPFMRTALLPRRHIPALMRGYQLLVAPEVSPAM
jgi:hypothetical protein